MHNYKYVGYFTIYNNFIDISTSAAVFELRIIMLTMVLGLITYFTHGILNNYLDTDKATIPVWGFTAIMVMLDLKYPRPVKINAKKG